MKLLKIERLFLHCKNEIGADDLLWLPGGKTSGGYSEGIVDLSNKNIPYKNLLE